MAVAAIESGKETIPMVEETPQPPAAVIVTTELEETGPQPPPPASLEKADEGQESTEDPPSKLGRIEEETGEQLAM